MQEPGKNPLPLLRVLLWTLGIGTFMVIALIGVIVWHFVFDERPPLSVKFRDDKIVVVAMHLGEYMSSISRINVSDPESGEIVWMAVSTDPEGWSNFWCVHFVPGENEELDRLPESFQTIIPGDDQKFVLEPGKRYRVKVWASDQEHTRSRIFLVPELSDGYDAEQSSDGQITAADIEGVYYTEYHDVLYGFAYGFIVVQDGVVTNDHGLYRDLYRKSVVREPYQPERSKYAIRGNILEIIDESKSFEVEKLGLFGVKTISKNPEYRIVRTDQGLRLESLDSPLTYTRLVEV